MPQDDTVDRRVFVGMGKLSSLTDVAAMQWSYTMGQDSLSKEKHEAVANHDDSTHGEILQHAFTACRTWNGMHASELQ